MPRSIILTALPVEYAAVRSHLRGVKEEVHPKETVYENGSFEDWEVLIAEIGPGNEQAALEAERAISYFEPDVALFVGIAGGLKDVALGDVVVATKVYGYESGKDGEDFQPRADVGNSSYPLQQRARAESRRPNWSRRLDSSASHAPKVSVAPIAAGEKVVASIRSRTWRFLREQYGDAVAVEMEGHGFLKALHANADVKSLIVRGVSDLIDAKSETDEAGWQEIAANHASAFAFEVLSKYRQLSAKEGPAAEIGIRDQEIHVDSTNLARTLAKEVERFLTNAFDTRGLALEILSLSPLERVVPPVPPDLAVRAEVLSDLKARLQEQKNVVITGSTGMGKTTLAKILANEVDSDVAWLGITALDSSRITASLFALALSISDLSNASLIVIDDIDLYRFSSGEIEAALSKCLRTAQQRGCLVLITTQRRVPGRLSRLLGLRDRSEFRVPCFSEEEIEEFARALGCPSLMLKERSRLTYLHTRGHPQLVHARLLHLKYHGWPKPLSGELLHKPPELSREQMEARFQLPESVPKECVNFVYYLSTVGGPFRRDHAVAIGELPELLLQNPSDAFDQLHGPWIEEVGHGYYRVSALLKDSAEELWSRKRKRDIDTVIANIFLDAETLNLRDMDTALLHALSGQANEPFRRICYSLLQASDEEKRKLAQELSWLISVKPESGIPIPGHPRTNCCFRALQFQLAARTKPELCEDIVRGLGRGNAQYLRRSRVSPP